MAVLTIPGKILLRDGALWLALTLVEGQPPVTFPAPPEWLAGRFDGWSGAVTVAIK